MVPNRSKQQVSHNMYIPRNNHGSEKWPTLSSTGTYQQVVFHFPDSFSFREFLWAVKMGLIDLCIEIPDHPQGCSPAPVWLVLDAGRSLWRLIELSIESSFIGFGHTKSTKSNEEVFEEVFAPKALDLKRSLLQVALAVRRTPHRTGHRSVTEVCHRGAGGGSLSPGAKGRGLRGPGTLRERAN